MEKITRVSAVVLGLAVAVVLFEGLTALAANPAGNLDQCANGPASSPQQCTGSAWQNGNLNPNQAHYAEGQSVPFRIVLTDVPTSGVNTLVIEYDIKHGGGHAYDYLTSYNRTETSADPCSGVSPCSFSGTAPIPTPSSTGSPVLGVPTTSFSALPLSEQVISIYNGSFTGTGVTYISQGDLNASQSVTQVRIQFTASGPTVVLAWGGHIASSLDWGDGNSASGISGSPYHMRFIELNGSGGNQDRSLTSSAILPTTPSNNNAPQLIVNKIVINDNGGTKVISDFPLFIDGVSVTSGVVKTTTVGSHTISETSSAGYTAAIGGNCAANGTITLVSGDVKTCTITNNDIAPVIPPPPGDGGNSAVPPLIDLVKVPSPLSLPNGPGTVKYTYTLRNIGTVPVTNITLVGDTCSPIALISGDTNNDTKLDVNETWVYTCSTTLSSTHTNIVTATGWANGINATDIANATVIVGVPLVAPLIHVTKVPSQFVFADGGGLVTYSYKVTNPGTVALSNVRLSDDKCMSVNYLSGDTNSNSRLDITETWTYTCVANLTNTTVNTVTASADGGGLTARDFAIATVVVNAIIPKLPNTGFIPSEDAPWKIIIPTGILTILALFYLTGKKTV